ncbi:MAG: sugar ABC transporter ATP-binding protein [Anaerolinea sp.]|nr:sugar ABC transporter ATP-binding protein [Anaerolinea sp.]
MTQQDTTTPSAPSSPFSDPVVLRAENITKVYPGTVALDNVNFNVYRGKVNVLIGENGAGKSTLMKILAGVEQPTSGHIFLEEKEIHVRDILAAAAQGIGIIFQEMSLCPNLSVAENIYLAREVKQRGLTIDRKFQKEHTRELIQHLEQDIDPDALVSDLRIGQQQIVEIARALAQDVRILIMDEPTSALSTAEVAVLFRVINELKAEGVSIIYISHKLDELLQIGDFVTILRDGKLVETARAADISVAWIIEKMVGKNPASLFARTEQYVGEVLMRVEDLTLPRAGGGFVVDHVSFNLHAGEILGLYGLMGAGRSDVVDCLAGIRPEATGKVWINDQPVLGTTVSERIGSGIVLVPEDRQREGLVQPMSVHDNILLASLKSYMSGFFLAPGKEKEAVQEMVKRLSIRVANVNQPITSLSGGNQQKCVVAKALLTTPKVLMLDEPTRGIDVGAKSEIFEITTRLAQQGYGVIFISTELKEVLTMSDRILVMSKGAITGEFSRQEATEEKLVAASAVGHGLAGTTEPHGATTNNGHN